MALIFLLGLTFSCFCASFLPVDAQGFDGCDVTIRSGEDNSTGIVTTPGFETGQYPPNIQCLYRFMGKPKERVKITFTKFMVRGVMPECINDYVDIWIEVRDEDTELIDSPLFGRYCGVDHLAGPKMTISLTNLYVVAFFSDNEYQSKGIQIQYEFIDGAIYKMGKPAPPNVCGWTIENKSKKGRAKKGKIMTPSYPGIYPSNLFCFYKFKGKPGERIRLDFEDFNLFGDNQITRKPLHCPYDYVRVYDGFTNEAPTIATYCWKSKPFSVFSNKETLLVEFASKVGHDLINPGFIASYVISSKIVSLGFVEKQETTHHIRGTECDQRIMSQGESKGVILSPNYPSAYPLNLKCHYYVDGLDNRDDLEVANLQFLDLNIPTSDSKCSNGSVSIYVQGRPDIRAPPLFSVTKISHALDIKKYYGDPDYKFCGSTKPSNPIIGMNPRTLIIFDSNEASKSKGFKAKYEFIKRFGVEGTATPDSSCEFRYNSGGKSEGAFNSPRYPGLYSNDLHCQYFFLKSPGEQVFVGFKTFQVESNAEKLKKMGRCSEDLTEIRNVFADGSESLVGLYCGDTLPGPAASDPKAVQLKLTFKSNAEKDDDGDGSSTGSGFSGDYAFLPSKPQFLECGAELFNEPGGAIAVTDYSSGAFCEWKIRATRGRVLLTFNSFAVEGGGAKGCSNAVLRVYKDASPSPNSMPLEICGSDKSVIELLSHGSTMNVEFISMPGAEGGAGFTIGWAEARHGGYCPGNTHFKCKKSGHCISRLLVCDRIAHCGVDNSDPESLKEDASDERESCPHYWPIPVSAGPVSEKAVSGASANVVTLQALGNQTLLWLFSVIAVSRTWQRGCVFS